MPTEAGIRFSRRRLPHLYAVGQPLFVTFRLHDSLPLGRQFPKESMTSGEAFVAMDRLLDTCRSGPLYLKMPDIARIVVGAIQQGGQSDYILHTWVVMPNHVHLLITPEKDVSTVLQKLKGTTAREANRMLERAGMPFWQHESYDRLVRTAEEFQRIGNYIIRNPVRAGLAGSPEEYPWSSVSTKAG